MKCWMTARTFRLIKGDMLLVKAVSSFPNSMQTLRAEVANINPKVFFRDSPRLGLALGTRCSARGSTGKAGGVHISYKEKKNRVRFIF